MSNNYDIKDISLAEKGRFRMQWAAREMPVLDLIEAALREGAAAEGHAHVGLPARHQRDRQPDARAAGRRRRRGAVRVQPALDAGRRRRLAGGDYGMPVYAIKGEDNETYYQHIKAALDLKPHITMDDGADLVGTLHKERRELLDGIIGGTEETTTGVIRLRAMAARRRADVPGRRRQRRADQAPVRQPLRHRPEHARRHHPRHQRPARRQDGRRRRLRLVQPRHRHARQGPGRQRHRHRDRPAEGAGSGHGRLPRHADGRGAPRSATSSSPPPATSTSSTSSTSRR